MNRRKITNLIIISILLLSIIAYFIDKKIYYKHFYQTNINSVVIKPDDFQRRAIKFIFADDNYVYMLAPWEIKC